MSRHNPVDSFSGIGLKERDGIAVRRRVQDEIRRCLEGGKYVDGRREAAAAVRAEAEELAADEGDRAEAMQVLRDMETLRAW